MKFVLCKKNKKKPFLNVILCEYKINVGVFEKS